MANSLTNTKLRSTIKIGAIFDTLDAQSNTFSASQVVPIHGRCGSTLYYLAIMTQTGDSVWFITPPYGSEPTQVEHRRGK